MAEPKRATSRVRSTSDASLEKKRAQELAGKHLSDQFGSGDPNAPKRVLVYGESGIGKTKFFANIPGAIFLSMESGVNQLPQVNRYKGTLDTMEDLYEVLAQLRYGKHDYRALILESPAEIDQRIIQRLETRLAATAGKDSATNLSEVNETERGAGYDLVRDEWRELLNYLDAIRTERSMVVGFAASARVGNVALVGDRADYQRYEPQISVSTKARQLLKAWVDYMLYFAAEVTTAKNPRTGKTIAQFGNRYIYTRQEPGHDAKCRGDIAWPRQLPLDIQDGWRMFDELSSAITTHGRNLDKHLFEVAAEVAAKLPQKGTGPTARAPEVRRTAMMEAVLGLLETKVNERGEVEKEPDYFLAWEAIDRAKKEVAAEQAQG